MSYRQVYVKGAAVTGLRININETSVADDSTIYDGKPEPGSFRCLLGCEKRLKDMLPNFFIHPGPVIRNCNADIVLIFNSRKVFAQFITGDKRGAQFEAPCFLHSVAGVQAKI